MATQRYYKVHKNLQKKILHMQISLKIVFSGVGGPSTNDKKENRLLILTLHTQKHFRSLLIILYKYTKRLYTFTIRTASTDIKDSYVVQEREVIHSDSSWVSRLNFIIG